MSELPGDLLYTNDHEWLRRESDGSVTIGITEHAANAHPPLPEEPLHHRRQDGAGGPPSAALTPASPRPPDRRLEMPCSTLEGNAMRPRTEMRSSG